MHKEKDAYFTFYNHNGEKYVLWVLRGSIWQWKMTLIRVYPHCLHFHLCLWKMEIKCWVHCGERRRNFRWPGRLCWETICLCKMWQGQKVRSSKISTSNLECFCIITEQWLWNEQWWGRLVEQIPQADSASSFNFEIYWRIKKWIAKQWTSYYSVSWWLHSSMTTKFMMIDKNQILQLRF